MGIDSCARHVLTALLLVFAVGCGARPGSISLAYNQGQSLQIGTTQTYGEENGIVKASDRHDTGGALPPPSSNTWPPDCFIQEAPSFRLCNWDENEPGSTYRVPMPLSEKAIEDVQMISTFGTVNYVPPDEGGAHLIVTVRGNKKTLYHLVVDADNDRHCTITLTPPNGGTPVTVKSCTLPIPQIKYAVDLPSTPITVEYDPDSWAGGPSTFSLNNTHEYLFTPLALSGMTLIPEDALPADCTPIGTLGCTTLNDLPWGSCSAHAERLPDGRTKAVFTITIKGAQTPENAWCPVALPARMRVASITGELGYRGGGDGHGADHDRASMNMWLFGEGLRPFYGAKVALQPGTESTRCLIEDPHKSACVFPIEGPKGSPPITFESPIDTNMLVIGFNSDLNSAHPDTITLVVFLSK